MKKLTLTLLIGLFGATCILAQAPQAFKYQTVIRDNSGELIINQPVSIRIEILKDSIIGTPLYSEIHSKTTNQFGLITIDIGAGTVESGIFEYISWGTSFHFLKIELDETGNSNYQLMGISQLLSVPYALNSGSLTLTDVNGQSYTLGVDTLGNLTTITQFKTCGEDTLQDPRDFQKYPTVQIGSQCWMAKNLNIGTMVNGSIYQSINDTIEKYCFYNDTAYCDTYGGLYQWDEMMQYMTTEGIQGICPDGWHIPTDVEWCTLENYVDDFLVPCNLFGWRGYTAGAHLKEAGWDHWSVPNQGYNSYGFTALPGGYYMPGNSFNTLHNNAYFWSSSDNGVIAAGRGLNHITPYVFRGYEPKSNGYSVRCLWNGGGIGENALPAQPTDPTPPDGAIDQFTSISLSWSCTDPDGDPLSYSVYFGETNPPPSVGGG